MTSGEPIEAVVFDWDGTLMDSKAALLASYHQATTEVLGAPFPVEPADVEEIIQLRAAESFAIISKGDAELSARIAEAFHRAYKDNQARTQPFDGTLEALRELRDLGVKLGVATSKARMRMELEGDRTGITALMDDTVTGDDVERAKPDPEPVAKAIAQLGTEPGRTLYVGDGPNDVIAAKGAGAIAVGVSFGFHPDEMRDAGPHLVVDHPGEIVALVRRRAGAAA